MKKLVCEMCGGTDLIKQDGVFVCQYCGIKYSVEEARKMMIDGTVDVQGTVKIDRTDEHKKIIENYLAMCKTAYESLDTVTVVEYSDKILEMDPENSEAWTYKALSCGWDSSLSNLKTQQIITVANKALELAPEEKRYEIAEEIFNQGKMQIELHLQRARSLSYSYERFEMINSVMIAWVRLVSEIPYLPSERMEAEIKECQYVTDRDRITFMEALQTWNGEKPYDEMKHYDEMMRELVEPEYARRRTEYWSSHANEKVELEEKKIAAETEKAVLDAEMEEIPELAAKSKMDAQIADLTKQMGLLGVFKGKEKKVLQAQINEVKKNLAPIETVLEDKKKKIQERIDAQIAIINDIENELTKIR